MRATHNEFTECDGMFVLPVFRATCGGVAGVWCHRLTGGTWVETSIEPHTINSEEYGGRSLC